MQIIQVIAFEKVLVLLGRQINVLVAAESRLVRHSIRFEHLLIALALFFIVLTEKYLAKLFYIAFFVSAHLHFICRHRLCLARTRTLYRQRAVLF